MLNNITIGSYINKNSIVHEMHPLSKLICALLFIIANLITNDLKLIIAFILCTLIIIALSNINYRVFIKSIIIFIIPIAIIFMIGLPFGLETAVIIIIKTILIIENITLFISTTQLSEITYGLSITLFPLRIFRIDYNKIALKIRETIRFIPVYIEEREAIKENLKIYHVKITFVEEQKLILKNTKGKLNSINNAIKIKGYNLEEYRTSLKTISWQFADTALVFGYLLIVVLIIREGGIL